MCPPETAAAAARFEERERERERGKGELAFRLVTAHEAAESCTGCMTNGSKETILLFISHPYSHIHLDGPSRNIANLDINLDVVDSFGSEPSGTSNTSWKAKAEPRSQSIAPPAITRYMPWIYWPPQYRVTPSPALTFIRNLHK